MPNVEPHGFRPLSVTGVIPDKLRGTLFRTGPALFERGGHTLKHPFEADGGLVGVRFEADGRVRGGVEFVRGNDFDREQAAGRFLSGAAVSRPRRVLNTLRGHVKNTGNTAVMSWQRRLFTLMEAAKPIEMCPETLATLGETDLDGAVPVAFSAHPHRHRSGDIINFGVAIGPTTHLDIMRLPTEGPARHLGKAPMPWPTMLHDFALVDDTMLFVCGPAQLRLARALVGEADMDKLFEWRPGEGARLMIVPIDAPEQTRMIEIPACWVWHVVNGFRDGDAWVLDVSEYPNMDSLGGIRDRGSPIAPPYLVRYRVGVSSDRVEREVLWDVPVEFPSVPKSEYGRAGARALLLTIPEGAERSDSPNGVAFGRPERDELQHVVFGEGVGVSEPIHVEEAGVVLCLVNDEPAGTSRVAVLDDAHLADGPVAEIDFDQLLHQTFHGTFVSA